MLDQAEYLQEVARAVRYRKVAICFVCAGNICRSPMAEAVAKDDFARAKVSNISVSSAGTGSWHLGEDADWRARSALARHGLELLGHRAKKYQDSWSPELDLVVALDRANYSDLARLSGLSREPHKLVLLRTLGGRLGGTRRHEALDVPDPYLGTEADFAATLEIIRASMAEVVKMFSP